MAGMVRRIHALGLKAGIYSTPMVHAWGSRDNLLLPGSTGYPLDPDYFHPYFGGCGKRGFEEVDARQFAQWGFDWLKYDWNRTEPHHTRLMREALDRTGRDIVLQVCTGCKVSNAVEYAASCELVRGNTDTRDDWAHLRDRVMKRVDPWLKHIRPGFWYDLDMLAVGDMLIGRSSLRPPRPGEKPDEKMRNHLTEDEVAFHFCWWAIIPAPLILSCDIINISDSTLGLVTNADLLEINQDYPAKPAEFKDFDNGTRRLWMRELSDGRTVLGFFNIADGEWQVSHALPAPMEVRDVLPGADLGVKTELSFTLRPHSCKVLILKSQSSL
jgi:alpha-galactosidase